MNPERITLALAQMAIDQLDDLELAAFNNSVQADFGNPKLLKGYNKVSHLFTLQNGTRTEGLIKDAFARETLRRLT
jgi:hypothetical protein